MQIKNSNYEIKLIKLGECSGVYVIENEIVLLDEEYYPEMDLIEAELECQTEEDLRKYYEKELRGDISDK